MIGAGVIGILGFLMMLVFMRDTPQSQGFLLDKDSSSADSQSSSGKQTEDFNKAQKAVFEESRNLDFGFYQVHLCISADMR